MKFQLYLDKLKTLLPEMKKTNSKKFVAMDLHAFVFQKIEKKPIMWDIKNQKFYHCEDTKIWKINSFLGSALIACALIIVLHHEFTTNENEKRINMSVMTIMTHVASVGVCLFVVCVTTSMIINAQEFSVGYNSLKAFEENLE